VKLLDLLSPDRILVPIGGETLNDAIAEIVKAMRTAGTVSDPDRFEELVGDTLPRDVVTIRQAFLLYFRTDAVPHLTVALGIAPEPLHREHDPSKQARIVLLVTAPSSETSRFLRTVSAFSRALGREEVVDKLLTANTPEDVLAIEALTEIELHDYLAVRDVMVHRRLFVAPETKLQEAAQLMAAASVPSLPVLSETGEVLGMVGQGELLRHLLPVHVKRMTGAEILPGTDDESEQKNPYDLTVREVMDRSLLCISEDQTIGEVATMMLSRNIDRFPVVRDGRLVGFLTRGDMVRCLFGR
jgi:CBS domain-containing protein